MPKMPKLSLFAEFNTKTQKYFCLVFIYTKGEKYSESFKYQLRSKVNSR